MAKSNGPIIEDGVIAGNLTDKYGTKNVLFRFMMGRFLHHVTELVRRTGARDVHEVGCGEGLLSVMLSERVGNLSIRASDFSARVIEVARQNARRAGRDIQFLSRSIYDLQEEDAAELVVSCEVLEHLAEPQRALTVLARLARPWLVLSVPREPIWRALNVVRLKYLADWGNTPGHVQRWSKRGFLRLLREHVDVVEVRCPTPWTIALCRSRAGRDRSDAGPPCRVEGERPDDPLGSA